MAGSDEQIGAYEAARLVCCPELPEIPPRLIVQREYTEEERALRELIEEASYCLLEKARKKWIVMYIPSEDGDYRIASVADLAGPRYIDILHDIILPNPWEDFGALDKVKPIRNIKFMRSELIEANSRRVKRPYNSELKKHVADFVFERHKKGWDPRKHGAIAAMAREVGDQVPTARNAKPMTIYSYVSDAVQDLGLSRKP